MKKNGFTLIELLGVIVILSILSLIAIPVIDSSLNKGKDNLYKIQEEQLIKALKDYYAEHLVEFGQISSDESSPSCRRIGELKDYGYLPTDLNDPKTNEPLSENIKVCALKDNKNVKYYVEKS